MNKFSNVKWHGRKDPEHLKMMEEIFGMTFYDNGKKLTPVEVSKMLNEE